MCKFYVFADFSGKGLKEGGAVIGEDDVRMREFDSYSDVLAAVAAAYAMGANDVRAIISFPKTRRILDELSKQLRLQVPGDRQKVEEGHTPAN